MESSRSVETVSISTARSKNPADPPSYCSLFDREPANGRVHLRPDYDYNAFSGKKTISYQKRTAQRRQTV